MTTSTVSPRSKPPQGSLGSGDFRRITERGERALGPTLSAVACKREDEGLRVGFTVGRRVGGAVRRNRARRLMREAWRSLEATCQPGFDLIFMARPEIRGRKMAAVAAEMNRLLHTLGVIR